jgi:hypothetical protein
VDDLHPEPPAFVNLYFNRFAYSHWSFEEIRLGRAFAFLKMLWEQPMQAVKPLSPAGPPKNQRVAVLTCTGGRPEAMRLCEKYIRRQTHRDFDWVVVDDYPVPSAPATAAKIIRPQPFWDQRSGHTLVRNMKEGLRALRDYDVIIFWEDDDWYAEDYVEVMLKRFASLPDSITMIGECYHKYWNARSRLWLSANNTGHASLSTTAIRGSMIEKLHEMLLTQTQPFIDLAMWKAFRGEGYLFPGGHQFGIKGLPGRPGIGAGHRLRRNRSAQTDEDMSVLRSWIGDDANQYERFYDPDAKAPPEGPKRTPLALRAKNRVITQMTPRNRR